jgi:hypothetical protein
VLDEWIEKQYERTAGYIREDPMSDSIGTGRHETASAQTAGGK